MRHSTYLARESTDALMRAGTQISKSLQRNPETEEGNPSLQGSWWYVRASTLQAINVELDRRGYTNFAIPKTFFA
jgi:hypothetical protein